MVRDRGMYICTAENAGGVAQASAIVEVERKFFRCFDPFFCKELRNVVKGNPLTQNRMA